MSIFNEFGNKRGVCKGKDNIEKADQNIVSWTQKKHQVLQRASSGSDVPKMPTRLRKPYL